jgi:hypothetical protein
MINPQVFAQTLAAVGGIGILTPISAANWRSARAVSKITRESINENDLEAPVERESALCMQWMVSKDGEGSRCLKAQWEKER